jgi:predicted peptidase
MKSTLIGIVACLTLITGSGSAFGQAAPEPGPGRGPGEGAPRSRITIDPRAESRTYHLDGANIEVPYCVYRSTRVSSDKPAPLVVSLHGMGATPSIMCNSTAVDLAEAGGYILVAPMGYSTTGWYGSPVITMRRPGAEAPVGGPSNADIEKWSEADVMNVLATMRKEFNVDPKRIYLTGHSMGGAGTLFLASKHADLWAAAAPVAPASFMMNATRADILRGIQKAGLPLMIVQGDVDTVVPATNTRLWVDTAREIGLKDFKYVEQPGIDHGPVITSSQKDIFEFFAAHSKK